MQHRLPGLQHESHLNLHSARSFGVIVAVAVVAVATLVGCGGPPDGTAARLAERVTHEQAEQNQRVAEAMQQLTQGNRELIVAEGRARQEILTFQRELRLDQAEVARQRNALERERRQIASQRLLDSQAASALTAIGMLLACLAPLALAAATLLGLWRPTSHDEVAEVVVEHWATQLSSLPPASTTPLPREPLIGPPAVPLLPPAGGTSSAASDPNPDADPDPAA
ncbi:MAG: hypothetical protein U0939_22055 [Pirellulales bacterium]